MRRKVLLGLKEKPNILLLYIMNKENKLYKLLMSNFKHDIEREFIEELYDTFFLRICTKFKEYSQITGQHLILQHM